MLLSDKQRKAVDKYHQNKRNEARNETMRQAINLTNQVHFGKASDVSMSLPQRLALISGTRHEAGVRHENMRQALNVVNREYFGMPSDNRKNLPQHIAISIGPKKQYNEWMDDLERQIEEAVEGIGRLRGEIRRHDAADEGTGEWILRSVDLANELQEYTQWYRHLLDERTRLEMFAHAQEELRRARRIDL